jgi:hypothetical protein
MLKTTSQSNRRKWIESALDKFYRAYLKLEEKKGGENCIMRNVFVCDDYYHAGCDVM